MRFKPFFYESTDRVDENFRAQFIGALSVVFDIDTSDIVDKESKEHRSYGSILGISDLRIGDYWFSPNNANCAVKSKFFIFYKMRKYEVKVDVINWLNQPSLEDMENNNKGKTANSIKRNPIDFNKPMTATGEVEDITMYYDVDSGKEKEDWVILSPSIHNYPEHFRFESLDQLASKIKSIIDGYDGRKTNIKPVKNSPLAKRPVSTKNSPVLA